MRHWRYPRTLARPAVILIVGLALGLLVAMQIVAMIREARVLGTFGAPAAPAVAPDPVKPTEEDERIGVALAAATGVRTAEDCLSLAPEHRPACRSYVERRREEVPLLR